MTVENAEDLGFLQSWDGLAEPNDAEDWPDNLLAAWQRGAQMFRDWK